MSKFLVTGSAGLIGTQIVKDLVEMNFEVYSCYTKNKPNAGISKHLELSEENEIRIVLNEIKPDIVIHLGAITDVDQCEEQKEIALLINEKATQILAEESVKINAFFIYVSTDYVFDGKVGMKNEEDTPNPINFYGKSKLNGEGALKKLIPSCLIIRTSTPFGLHPKKKTFPLWVKENLELKNEIPVVIDQFTSPTYVPNLSKMIIEVAIKKNIGIIHLAGRTRISRYEFARKIAEKLDLDPNFLKPIKMADMKWRAERPEDSSLDVSKAYSTLDNKPQDIEESLEFFIKEM